MMSHEDPHRHDTGIESRDGALLRAAAKLSALLLVLGIASCERGDGRNEELGAGDGDAPVAVGKDTMATPRTGSGTTATGAIGATGTTGSGTTGTGATGTTGATGGGATGGTAGSANSGAGAAAAAGNGGEGGRGGHEGTSGR